VIGFRRLGKTVSVRRPHDVRVPTVVGTLVAFRVRAVLAGFSGGSSL